MQLKTGRMILLIELENKEVHQAVLSKAQEDAIRTTLKSLPETVQLISEPLDVKIVQYDEV